MKFRHKQKILNYRVYHRFKISKISFLIYLYFPFSWLVSSLIYSLYNIHFMTWLLWNWNTENNFCFQQIDVGLTIKLLQEICFSFSKYVIYYILFVELYIIILLDNLMRQTCRPKSRNFHCPFAFPLHFFWKFTYYLDFFCVFASNVYLFVLSFLLSDSYSARLNSIKITFNKINIFIILHFNC